MMMMGMEWLLLVTATDPESDVPSVLETVWEHYSVSEWSLVTGLDYNNPMELPLVWVDNMLLPNLDTCHVQHRRKIREMSWSVRPL